MRRAIVIGSNGPPDQKKLEYAESDAIRVTSTLSSLSCGFKVEKAVGLRSGAARTKFLRACEACVPGDTFVAYFAGHGLINEGDLFFLFSNTDYERPMETCIRGDEVLTAMKRCKASNRLLVLDCCNAGQITGKTGIRSGLPDRVMMKDLGFVSDLFEIILASDALESAREFAAIGGGFLSTALIDGLSDRRSEADADRDGAISVHDMETWLHGQASDFNRRQQKREDRVPIPRKVGSGQGTTFLSRPAGDWLYYEVEMPDGIPGVVLPVKSHDGTHAYVIGKFPVTIEAFRRSHEGWPGPVARKFHGTGWEKSTFEVFADPDFGQSGNPVVGIDLEAALRHCQWLRKKARALIENIAPPTPVLWETALFGNGRQRDDHEWLRVQPAAHSRAQSTISCLDALARANQLGIVDLIGNVWEWCIDEDDWEWFTYGRRPAQDRKYAVQSVSIEMETIQPNRLRAWLKGGSFYDDLEQIGLTVAVEDIAGGPNSCHADVGFRWSATIDLKHLPGEVRDFVQASPPLASRKRRMPATA